MTISVHRDDGGSGTWNVEILTFEVARKLFIAWDYSDATNAFLILLRFNVHTLLLIVNFFDWIIQVFIHLSYCGRSLELFNFLPNLWLCQWNNNHPWLSLNYTLISNLKPICFNCWAKLLIRKHNWGPSPWWLSDKSIQFVTTTNPWACQMMSRWVATHNDSRRSIAALIHVPVIRVTWPAGRQQPWFQTQLSEEHQPVKRSGYEFGCLKLICLQII